MTLASDIISRGYREANFSAISASPTPDESTEGLALLQSLMDSFFPLVVGTKARLWQVPFPQRTAPQEHAYPAYPGDQALRTPLNPLYPPLNTRMLVKTTTETTIWFQDNAQDGAMMAYTDLGHTADVILDANGALFGTTGFASTQTITPRAPDSRNPQKTWVFRADYGSWVEIPTLATTTEIPFPTTFDDYWVTEMAMRLAPRFGNDPRQITLLRNKEMKVYIREQYLQHEEVLGAAVEPTSQSYAILTEPTGFSNGSL